MDRPITRRHFLKASCAAMTSTTLFSSLGQLAIFNSAAAQNLAPGEDYRALVCVLLAGGNDSFNMLVPHGADEYQAYATIRADLALAQETLLPLNYDDAGRSFAVHGGMPELRDLFDNGNAAFLANIGTLVEPVTLDGLEDGTAEIPLGLYSHADQIDQWQTSIPDQRTATGWGGRMADIVESSNDDTRVSMNISLGGSNIFQAGDQAVEYGISLEGAPIIEACQGQDFYGQLCSTAVDSLMSLRYRNLIEQAYADKFRDARSANKLFNEALAAGQPLTTTFSGNPLSGQLEMVAKTIAARQSLGHRRQTFFVTLGSWDHHDEVLDSQAEMLPWVSQGLAEFYAATQELGLASNVTTFTISDFGRTLTSNGQGSDHGWGGNQIVVGGAVNGARLFGQYPQLYAGNPLDTGRGRLIPTTPTDVLFAELALWFGVDRSQLADVLPNLGRFYDVNSSEPPIGVLNV